MDLVVSFFISVAASISAYYICKWLDRVDASAASLGNYPPLSKIGIENPTVAAVGFSFDSDLVGI